MSHGIPLTDSDRAPWLAAIRGRILDFIKSGTSLVVVCSALEQKYRDFLDEGISITWVYLKGSEELIRSRMKHRPTHFMKANMLPSQFAALEEPSDADAIVVDITLPPGAIVEKILARLGIPDATPRSAVQPPEMPENVRNG